MRRALRIPRLILISVLAMVGLFSLGVAPGAAQQPAPAPHPAHIHNGTCAQLDPTPQYPLNDVGPRTTDDQPPNPADFKGQQSAIQPEVSSTTIDAKLDDLLAQPHALNVHESAQNINNYIACGDLGGFVIDDTLVIGLLPQNNSGFSGVAILKKDGDKTQVDVYLVQGTTAAGAAAATPAATTPPAPTPAATTPPAAPSPTAAPSGGQASTSPTVNLIDINFDPKEITIPANTDVTVTLVNKGATAHNFNIDQLNVHSGDIQPGQTGSVTITAPAGDYQYYCNIPGHKEAGMIGTLHVQ
jgi:plastocyanin